MVREPTASACPGPVGVMCLASAVILNIGLLFKSLDIFLKTQISGRFEAVVSQLEQMRGCLGGGVPITPTLPGPTRLCVCLLGPFGIKAYYF